jgi:hypothetical protein
MGNEMTGMEWVIVGFVIWAVSMVSGLVSWTLYRTDRNYQRSLDCLMTLMDKEAAVVSAQVGRHREAPRVNGKAATKKDEKQKMKERKDSVLSQIEHTGQVTEEQAEFLEKNSGI